MLMLTETEKTDRGSLLYLRTMYSLIFFFSVSLSLLLSYQLSSPGPLQVVGSVALCSYASHSTRGQRELPGSPYMGNSRKRLLLVGLGSQDYP